MTFSLGAKTAPLIRLLLTFMVVASTANPVAAKARDYLKQSDDWFRSAAGRQRLENLLSHQDRDGCWPKNIDTTETLFPGKRQELKGTFDNSATVNELRLLARAYRVTNEAQYKKAFDEGITCILDAQYENGGWPQSPHPRGYAQHITFNDGTMVGLMTLLREVHSDSRYDFVSAKMRRQAIRAFHRGVACILACQIKVNGKLTVWCAQHDQTTFEPRGARSYEHPSLSGGESAGIVCLLMSLDDPSDESRFAVRAAVEWYGENKITGIRVKRIHDDKKVVQDSTAPPLWARFYDITTGRPIFSGRDGIIKHDIAEIEAERRNGYSWYGSYGARIEECRPKP